MPDKESVYKAMFASVGLNVGLGSMMAFVAAEVTELDLAAICSAVAAFFFTKAVEMAGMLRTLRIAQHVVENQHTVEDPDLSGNELAPETDAFGYALDYEDRNQRFEYIVTAGNQSVRCFSDTAYRKPDDLKGMVRFLKDTGRIEPDNCGPVSIEILERSDE